MREPQSQLFQQVRRCAPISHSRNLRHPSGIQPQVRTRFTYWGKHHLCRRTALLSPGVLDERATRIFTDGRCHSFATAMHRLTGWKFVGQYREGCLVHLLVLEPRTGLAVDAESGHDMDASYRVLRRKPRLNRNWLPLQADDAMPFAKARLDQILWLLADLPRRSGVKS